MTPPRATPTLGFVVPPLLAVVTLVVLGASSPANAHPFGPPPTLGVEVDDGDVVLQWRAASDDLTALAGALGLVATSQTFVYDAEGNLESAPEPEDVQLAAVASQPALDDYLRRHVTVSSDGRPCPVTADSSDFPTLARLVAACPGPPSGDLDLEVTLLQDLHPAYRTVVTSAASGDRAVLTSAAPRASLSVEPESVSRAVPGVSALVVVGVVAVVAGGAAWLLRRRRAAVLA